LSSNDIQEGAEIELQLRNHDMPVVYEKQCPNDATAGTVYSLHTVLILYSYCTPNDAMAAALDKNHNHFILVDSKREGDGAIPWQAELGLRGGLEELICSAEADETTSIGGYTRTSDETTTSSDEGQPNDKHCGKSGDYCLLSKSRDGLGESIRRHKNERPSVYIAVGGGIGTVETLHNCLRHNVPVVLLAGSGRVATLFAEAWRYYHGGPEAWRMARQEELKETLRQHEIFVEEQLRQVEEGGTSKARGAPLPCPYILELVDE
jgi:hypothetical protein